MKVNGSKGAAAGEAEAEALLTYSLLDHVEKNQTKENQKCNSTLER